MVVLMDEILGMIEHVVKGVDVNSETVPLDLIDRVGPAGTYIAEDHTYENFRRFWYPDVFSRTRYEVSQAAETTTLDERLTQKAQEILETHEVEPLSDDVLKDLSELEKGWMARATSG
jgi:trimethylamine--corrinoid protein Co-methyltransferase